MTLSLSSYLLLLIGICVMHVTGVFLPEQQGDICEVEGSTCLEYVNGTVDLSTCVLLQGQLLNNVTCDELGYQMGSCCTNGNCVRTTVELCLVVEGEFTLGGSCPCKGVPSSCCVGEYCSEGLDETTCESENGVFFANRSCAASMCKFLPEMMGSCCDSTRSICYVIPERYCKGLWEANTTCSQRGCFPHDLVPVTNTSKPGRCCGTSCYDQNPEDCIFTERVFYQYGYQCTNEYPCFPRGICVTDTICYEALTEKLCFLQGGTWNEGGDCNTGFVGKCSKGEHNCNNLAENTCPYEFDNTTTCDYIPHGACCSEVIGTCRHMSNLDCSVYSSEFYPGETCSNIPCAIDKGSCCISGICVADLFESLCVGQDNQYRSNQTCDYTGACESDLQYSNKSVDVPYDISLDNVSITTGNSNVTFGSTSLKKSSLILTNQTNFNFGSSLVLDSSYLRMDLSSTIRISGCLNLTDSTLQIDLTEEQYNSIREQQEIQVAQFSCFNGDGSAIQATVDNQGTDCIAIAADAISVVLLYVHDCDQQTPTSTLSGSPHLLPSLLLLLSYLL